MEDPYAILGVQRGDTAETIRTAYRKLAKKHHPDVNPGKPEAADRFKAIASAYDLLSDPDKRQKFDRGEIDAAGQETAAQREREFYRGEAGRSQQRSRSSSGSQRRYGAAAGFDPEDLEGLFGQFGDAFDFGGRRPRKGRDASYGLTVAFLDAARGATRRIVLPDGRTLDVVIPPGMEDGHVLRLRGQGEPGLDGEPAGDALVEITVAPDKRFRREGDDIVLTLPVTLKEAVLGAAIEVPTVKGNVRVSIPPGSGDGTRLRLRGRGFGTGHQFVELRVSVPPADEPELAAFLAGWTPRHPADPREGDQG
jgi:DnaJ-class molecular chaperone